MKKRLLFLTPIMVVVAVAATNYQKSEAASDDQFCSKIDSVISVLKSSPLKLHGSNKERQEEFTVSTPKVYMDDATTCELTTSVINDSDIKGISYSYECEWSQNRGTSLESANEQASALANGIASCESAQVRTIENEREKKWTGRIKNKSGDVKLEVRVSKTSKYNRIQLKFSGITEG